MTIENTKNAQIMMRIIHIMHTIFHIRPLATICEKRKVLVLPTPGTFC